MVAISERAERGLRTSAYFTRLQNWLNNTEERFGSYMPFFYGDVLDPSRSDRENYDRCMHLYKFIDHRMSEGKAANPAKEHIHLKLDIDGNTSRVYNMSNGSLYAVMNKDPRSGSVSYYGPVEGLQRFGGRNEFQGILQDMHDGKYDGGDYYHKKAA